MNKIIVNGGLPFSPCFPRKKTCPVHRNRNAAVRGPRRAPRLDHPRPGARWLDNPYMGVSINGGSSKSSILVGLFLINHPFLGYPQFRKPPYVFFFLIRPFNAVLAAARQENSTQIRRRDQCGPQIHDPSWSVQVGGRMQVEPLLPCARSMKVAKRLCKCSAHCWWLFFQRRSPVLTGRSLTHRKTRRIVTADSSGSQFIFETVESQHHQSGRFWAAPKRPSWWPGAGWAAGGAGQSAPYRDHVCGLRFLWMFQHTWFLHGFWKIDIEKRVF